MFAVKTQVILEVNGVEYELPVYGDRGPAGTAEWVRQDLARWLTSPDSSPTHDVTLIPGADGTVNEVLLVRAGISSIRVYVRGAHGLAAVR